MKQPQPRRDPETGEWRYRGKWYNSYPGDEIEADEAAYEDEMDRRMDERRLKNVKTQTT